MTHRSAYLATGAVAATAFGVAMCIDWVATLVALFAAAAWGQARWHGDRADEGG